MIVLLTEHKKDQRHIVSCYSLCIL